MNLATYPPQLNSTDEKLLMASWQIRADWLILTASGIPQIFLPVSDMKRSGSFKQIMRLAIKNGTEYK
jgi:hypothetical protein